MDMINRIFVIFLFLLVSSNYAQVRLGILGGINSTGFAGDDPPKGSFESDYGYVVGAIAEYYFLDDIAINIQPIYSHRSTIIQYDVTYQYEPYDSISLNLEYFELPLNVKVLANNKMSYVTAGLVLAVPLNSTVANNRSGDEIIIEDGFASYVGKASFSVGIQFNIGKPMMFIEFSYTQSLTNLTRVVIDEISLDNKLKSNSFQLSTGILFTL